jgi:hypothetical protein
LIDLPNRLPSVTPDIWFLIAGDQFGGPGLRTAEDRDVKQARHTEAVEAEERAHRFLQNAQNASRTAQRTISRLHQERR